MNCKKCGGTIEHECEKIPCYQCRKPFYTRELNKDFWGRCKDCVKETKRRLETKIINDRYSSGEWGRHAAQELKTFEKDTMQPLNKDGTISNKFVQTHGTKTLQKETGMSDIEIRKEAERYS